VSSTTASTAQWRMTATTAIRIATTRAIIMGRWLSWRHCGRTIVDFQMSRKGCHLQVTRMLHGDPANLCDTLRRLEREMKAKNCGTCAHEIDGWGVTGCEDGHAPDESGRCREWERIA